jgi:NADH:ubiquinone oxidoreductase subunit 6 (subunit J)
MKNRLSLAGLLLLLSPPVYAADMVAWKSYLAAIMLIALVAGTILSLRNKKAESRLAKILLAGLYFWVITFAELIILALIYHFTQ